MTRTELIEKLRKYEDAGFGPDYSILCVAADMLEADGKPNTAPKQLCAEQAMDLALWCDAVTTPEAYLQAALRKLHDAVETDGKLKPLISNDGIDSSCGPEASRVSELEYDLARMTESMVSIATERDELIQEKWKREADGKSLTDEAAHELWTSITNQPVNMKVVRAIEVAHEIGEKT